MKSYNDEYEERKEREKSLDFVGIEYLHCSTCAYIYVEGKIVYDVSKSDMLVGIKSPPSEVSIILNELARMSEKRWCDARWFAKKLSYSIKQWHWDDITSRDATAI